MQQVDRNMSTTYDRCDLLEQYIEIIYIYIYIVKHNCITVRILLLSKYCGSKYYET